MTVLPRTLSELPTKPLPTQNLLTGQQGSNGSPHPGGTGPEGAPEFAALLGTQSAQRPVQPSVGSPVVTDMHDLAERSELTGMMDLSTMPQVASPEALRAAAPNSLQVPVAQPMDSVEKAVSLKPDGVDMVDVSTTSLSEPVHHEGAPIDIHQEAMVAAAGMRPEISAPVQADKSSPMINGQVRLPVEMMLPQGQLNGKTEAPVAAEPKPMPPMTSPLAEPTEVMEGRRSEVAVVLGGQSERPVLRAVTGDRGLEKTDRSATAQLQVPVKTDGVPEPQQMTKPDSLGPQSTASGAKPDTDAVQTHQPLEPVKAVAPQTSGEPAAELSQVRPAPGQAAPVPADVANPIVQQPSASAALNTTTTLPTPSALDGADDLPRLQDVKVLSSRVIENVTGSLDRPGTPSTVKVIDLQLQPETLGRINAQLKQTGDTLEVRLEPSLAETALLLKEDRLALQRILGSLGSITDTAIVRIVDPVAEQRQVDEQDTVAGFESGETDQGAEQFVSAEDLRDGVYRQDMQQGTSDEVDDEGLGRSNARASSDIYI